MLYIRDQNLTRIYDRYIFIDGVGKKDQIIISIDNCSHTLTISLAQSICISGALADQQAAYLSQGPPPYESPGKGGGEKTDNGEFQAQSL